MHHWCLDSQTPCIIIMYNSHEHGAAELLVSNGALLGLQVAYNKSLDRLQHSKPSSAYVELTEEDCVNTEPHAQP